MSNNTSLTLTVVELRRLLVDLKNLQPDTGVRLRKIGEMWLPMFMRIILISEHGVILNDAYHGKIYIVENMVSVMQFEMDQTFRHYQPHFHYDVVPRVEYV